MASVSIEFGCCVTDLARATTDERLAQAFSHLEEIIEVKVDRLSTTGRSKGTGLVIFKQLRSAIDAIDNMTGRELDGHNITLELVLRIPGPAPYDYGITVGGVGYVTRLMEVYGCIVDNLSPNTTDESLAHAIARLAWFGGIIELKVSRDLVTGRSYQCGYLIFKEQSLARNAVDDMDGEKIDGRYITAKLVTQIPRTVGHMASSSSLPLPYTYESYGAGAVGGLPLTYSNVPRTPAPINFGYGAFCTDGYGCPSTVTREVGYGCSVFNLATTTTDESLGQLFSQFGEIIQSLVSENFVTKKFKGFVNFKERASVRAAVDAMDGLEIDGEKISVKVAHATGMIGYGVGRCECGLAVGCRQVVNSTTPREGGDVAREEGSRGDVARGGGRGRRRRQL